MVSCSGGKSESSWPTQRLGGFLEGDVSVHVHVDDIGELVGLEHHAALRLVADDVEAALEGERDMLGGGQRSGADTEGEYSLWPKP